MRNRCGQLAALLLLLAACGKSKEAKAFDQLGAACNALAAGGGTIASMDQLAYEYTSNIVNYATECRGDFVAVQQCPAATPVDPVCSYKYYFLPQGDQGACDQGACVCEVRYTAAAFQAQGLQAPLCASRFFKGQ